jgi:polysaccharide deacetylase 2 family uncharacterized protein YibQ
MLRRLLPIAFAALILTVILVFIFLNRPPRPGAGPGPVETAGLGPRLRDFLSGPEGGRAAVHSFRDSRDGWHIQVRLSVASYKALIPRLERFVRTAPGARILKKESEAKGGTLCVLWEIEGPPAAPDNRAALLFITPLPGTAPPPPETGGPPLAAIIIDDAGFNLELIKALAALDVPVTVAVLPNATLSLETDAVASRAGLEVMLHLPLESLAPPAGRPLAAIGTSMSPAEVRTAVEAFLGRVPSARGVNNHAGSKATEDPRVMAEVLEVIKKRGLYFIDSRTSPRTVALDAARAMGIRSAGRRLFLDTPPGRATVESRLRELVRLARKNGRAVAIGHAKSETIAALGDFLKSGGGKGVRFVSASEIVR